jgi:hypothetical protein
MPFNFAASLVNSAIKSTGYTHQWQYCAPEWSDILMASTHSQIESNIAISDGWRVFQVGINENFMSCPASKEMNNRLTCVECGVCAGNRMNAKSVVIQSH